MGRHVNHFDAQDRLINRNEKILKNSGSLESRDPATLTLAEQLELEKKRKKHNTEKKQSQPIKLDKPRFSYKQIHGNKK